MDASDRQVHLARFFRRNYSYLAMMLLFYVSKYPSSQHTQNALFMAWKKHKPSRITFSEILMEAEHIDWITRVPGIKRSSRLIKANGNQLISDAALADEQLSYHTCWLFKSGTFSKDYFINAERSKHL